MGHTTLFQELVLESAHQLLKRGINRSNKHDAHEFSLSTVLADDWKRRLGEVSHSINDLNNINDNVLELWRSRLVEETLCSLDG